ncbi:phosphomethylpyrimidine synthase ThiC [Syntrophus aciditrophicus]|uniref:Phosphomethylpyrimidine synthase n=1 Tax=Syntrophus aciditrophicus (strain SB) TaxID=56780 RepID=THIC_SYNAS|nr:phosphomethylpyrimidine synthase ThiC [Syntrophus aciditrophicus]Q2LSU0.1 RecName: Full=Phosphomethylpyrimidine synthase; AltName: Full=Hydroxymethylpyrimidine phosphate synthase; Short=HMP-P synthase; Short=HMP-phosphate synthase; Short=HMPP synthase; AltName: Full=Thiamine biosynthesis protein ThiC [Syntrophus aciditrophicus SB]ABC77146.1 thiamine biosynthesis protein [Syntrophus aciditrophicus SB]
MTQLEMAGQGRVTEEMKLCAEKEGVSPEFIRRGVEEGSIVVVRNNRHTGIAPLAIGKGLRTKVNANLGTSRDHVDLEMELEKVRICTKAGADALMDLSTGGEIRAIRQAIVNASTMAVGTVPIYAAAAEALNSRKSIMEMTADEMFQAIEENGEDGVDFITVHCGVTRESVGRIAAQGRLLGIVSRGGSITARWMDYNDAENPLYAQYDRLLEIARRYDMVLSLGDGLRPGCLADATDRGQVQELIILGELCRRARARDVQVMIEGPGHVPYPQIEANIALQKSLCEGAPFYVLGPLPTDIAPGYDHITAAIGGALAGAAGADFLCYVTPSEHLCLPNLDDVHEGIVASRIAAHIADIAKGYPGAMEKDILMAKYRSEFNWNGQIDLSVDPDRSRARLERSETAKEEGCTMCGDLCAIKLGKKKAPC